MGTGAKGTISNPYTMAEFEELADAGLWQGGFVIDDGGNVTYTMAELTVTGYSGYSGDGSDGSDYDPWGSDPWGSDPWGSDPNGSDDYPWNGDDGTGGTGGTGGTPGGGTSGGGGGHHSNGESNNYNVNQKQYPFLYATINTVKNLASGLFNAIKLLWQERFVVHSNIVNGIERFKPYYSWKEHKLYVASDTGYDGLVHEIIHYFQDEEHMLDDESSDANNEYMAELLTTMIEIAMRGYQRPRDYYEPRYGFTDVEFEELFNCVRANTTFTNGEIRLNGDQIENYLESIPVSKWNEMMDVFIEYYRFTYQNEEDAKTRKVDNNPNYPWNWRAIINRMGFNRY